LNDFYKNKKGDKRRMTNLEYLEKVKNKGNFRDFVITNGNYGEHMEGRKIIALEIIAEELIEVKEELNIIANCQKLEITRKL